MTSREFAIAELHHHEGQGHNIEFDKRGGFFCKTCQIGCEGDDVGDISPCSLTKRRK